MGVGIGVGGINREFRKMEGNRGVINHDSRGVGERERNTGKIERREAHGKEGAGRKGVGRQSEIEGESGGWERDGSRRGKHSKGGGGRVSAFTDGRAEREGEVRDVGGDEGEEVELERG